VLALPSTSIETCQQYYRPEGAGDAVEDHSSDEERDTTDAETDAEATLAEESWCPPIPDTPDDPTENEIAGAADKLETMMNGSQPQANLFFQPNNSAPFRLCGYRRN
jgi:hypothetical protein